MRVLGKFSVKEYRDLYSLDLDELQMPGIGLEGMRDTDQLRLVEIEHEGDLYFEVQLVYSLERSQYPDEMPFDLVQGQEPYTL